MDSNENNLKYKRTSELKHGDTVVIEGESFTIDKPIVITHNYHFQKSINKQKQLMRALDDFRLNGFIERRVSFSDIMYRLPDGTYKYNVLSYDYLKFARNNYSRITINKYLKILQEHNIIFKYSDKEYWLSPYHTYSGKVIQPELVDLFKPFK